jgi:hypothetical protein
MHPRASTREGRSSPVTAQGWDEDDLLEQLRTAVRGAGVPTPTMVAAGEAAFSWRTVDAELAALTHDSLVGGSVLVRGGDAVPRSLVFEGRRLSVELDEAEEGLVGQLRPPASPVDDGGDRRGPWGRPLRLRAGRPSGRARAPHP